MGQKKDQADSGLDVIEASYRLVADASAFEDVIATWAERIGRVDSREIDRLDHPLLVRHLSAVGKLFDKVEPATSDELVLIAVNGHGPAAVISADRRVVAANPEAYECWGLRVGDPYVLEWLDSHSRNNFQMVRASAAEPGPGSHAILRTRTRAGGASLAECYVIEALDGGPGYVAVRALALNWTEGTTRTLSDAFALTKAEVEICRLLLDTRDTGRMARSRNTSVHTIRTQLRTIFSKTETATQVDLIRLVAMVCLRSAESGGKAAEDWHDPLSHQESFLDPDGHRIAYSWMGDPDGMPALLVHGMATGYLLPERSVEALCRMGIKLFAIQRPGFGNSEHSLSPDPLSGAAEAIVSLAEHLGVERWCAIGLSAGLPPLVRAAREPRSRISGILGVASYLPFQRSERFDEFPVARQIAFRLVRSSRHLADLVGQFVYRMTKARKSGFLNDYMYSDCESDRRALDQLECQEQLHAAQEFMITRGYRAISNDMRMMASDWTNDLQACPAPIKLFHGTDDPVVSIAYVRKLASEFPAIELKEFPDAGELLWRDCGVEMVEALASFGRTTYRHV